MDWTSEVTQALHSHGWSQCLVVVQEGVFENTLDLGVRIEQQHLEVGQVITIPPAAKHAMRCLGDAGRTLHVYTSKINIQTDVKRFNVRNMTDIEEDLRLNEPTRVGTLKTILESIRSHSVTTHSLFFMNQLFSGISPLMLMAEDLISQTKTTLATYEASPVFSTIETEIIEALGGVIGWPRGHRDGVGVPGGSAANFMAIHCARQRKFPEFRQTGMNGERLKIFVSSEAHYSFKKACVALGIGTDNLVIVPVDAEGRMDAEQLDRLIREHKTLMSTPIMVGATAGTTVLGVFDPVDKLSEICRKHDLWLHVDGAWGGPAIFSETLRSLVRGIEHADSFTFDAHKLFGASITCSFFLTKHVGMLLEANDVSGGDYLFHGNDPVIDRGKHSWQCGRKADAVSFWTIWKNLGTRGLGEFVDSLVEIRDQTLAWIKRQPRLQLVGTPEYLNICLRVTPPNAAVLSQSESLDWSRHVRETLKEENIAMLNYSQDSGGSFLRMILAHPYLKFEDVKQILHWVLAVK